MQVGLQGVIIGMMHRLADLRLELLWLTGFLTALVCVFRIQNNN